MNNKTLVIATNNKHKLKEFKSMMEDYTILTLDDIGYDDDIEETGNTFLENALIKAQTIYSFLEKKGLSYPVIADDSGLCVDSLNGAPGIYSARYAGNHDYQACRNKLIEDLKNKDKDAYFISTIVLYEGNENYQTFVGKTYGKIIEQELGSKEFGYDCIFYSNDLGKTFGEATPEEKNSVSHRSKAIQELKKFLIKES